MKTLSCLLIAALLLPVCPATAADWSRMGAGGYRLTPAQLEQRRLEALRTQSLAVLEAQRSTNPALAFRDAPITDLARVVDGRPVSLRPLLYWRNAGMAYWQAYQPFGMTNPLPSWTVVEGKVARLLKDGTVIVARANGVVALHNWPGSAEAVVDQPVRVLAVSAPRFVSGSSAMAAFDHGLLAAGEQLAMIQKEDAAVEDVRAAAQAKAAAAAAETEAKRKAEIAARVEKARLDRAAKDSAK